MFSRLISPDCPVVNACSPTWIFLRLSTRVSRVHIVALLANSNMRGIIFYCLLPGLMDTRLIQESGHTANRPTDEFGERLFLSLHRTFSSLDPSNVSRLVRFATERQIIGK